MGWENTLPFLILPVFLVISQFVSMQMMQPKSEDPQQQQANVILKFLPLMIGWFSLSVPSALCIYWVINNIVTTATTLLIRNSMPAPVTISVSGTAAATPPKSSIFAPPPIRDKPAGFGSSFVDDDQVKPLTPIDVEVESKIITQPAPVGKFVEEGDEEVEGKEESGAGIATGTTPSPSPSKSVRS